MNGLEKALAILEEVAFKNSKSKKKLLRPAPGNSTAAWLPLVHPRRRFPGEDQSSLQDFSAYGRCLDWSQSNGLAALMAASLKNQKAIHKLLRPAMGDNTAAGRRIIPAPKHHRSVGIRIDRGMEAINRIPVFVQPNRHADDRGLLRLAREDSHQVLTEAIIDLDDPKDDSMVVKFFAELEEDAKRKGFL